MSLGAQIGNRFKLEFLAKVISTFSGALLGIVLARILQPDSYGILFLSLSILGTLNLFSKLGISKSGARYISDFRETDRSQIPGIIVTSFIYIIASSFIISVCVLLTRQVLTDALGEPALFPFLTIGVFYIIFTTCTTFVRRILQGLEDIEPAASVQAIEGGGRLVFAVGFVLLGFGAIGALGGYIISSLIASVIGCYYIYTVHVRTDMGFTQPSNSLRKKIAKYSVPLAATRSADVLDKRVDTILVGFFLTPTAVSFYTIGKQVAEFLQSAASALGFTVTPTYSSLQTKGETEKAANVLEESITYILLLYLPAAAGLILVAEPMVRIVFGSEYTGAAPVVQLLALYAVLHSVASLVTNGLDYLGRARERAIIKIGTSVLNVILNIILIPIIGVVGAAAATVITYSIYTFTNIYVLHLEFDLNVPHIATRFSKVLVITLIMSLPVYGILSSTVGIVALIMAILSGVLVWFTLSMTIGWLDPKHIMSILN